MKHPVIFAFIALAALIGVTPFGPLQAQPQSAPALDLRDPGMVQRLRPLLIAHRGGVIGPQSPECSESAIRLAAAGGYAMVELDIRLSRDNIPMVFHDTSLGKACGIDRPLSDLPANELEKIRFLNSEDHILSLDSALELCAELGLGVMLDLKSGRGDATVASSINDMIHRHRLDRCSVSFSASPVTRHHFTNIMMTVPDDILRQLQNGGAGDLRGYFWFGLPDDLPDSLARDLIQSGCLVFPAINTFRYPKDSHMTQSKADIDRLIAAGVHGFQIDSVYFTHFGDYLQNQPGTGSQN